MAVDIGTRSVDTNFVRVDPASMT
jgi:hypothetical protein